MPGTACLAAGYALSKSRLFSLILSNQAVIPGRSFELPA